MREKYTVSDVANIVESEGLDYTILDYLSPSDIEDKQLKELFIKAREVLREIQTVLDTATIEDDELEYTEFFDEDDEDWEDDEEDD